MVSTHLKNTSQIGRFRQVGVKMINIGNHHLVLVYQTTQNHFAEKKQRFLQTNYTLFVSIPANNIPWVVPRPLPSNSDKWRCSSKSPNLKIQRHRGGDYLCSGKPELFPIYTAYLEDHPSVLRVPPILRGRKRSPWMGSTTYKSWDDPISIPHLHPRRLT